MTDTQTQSPAKPLPAAADHLPVSFLNPTRGRGIATMIGCSCGWKPKQASSRGSTRCNGHMAHRRTKGLPRLEDYSGTVYGPGYPAAGLTDAEWHAMSDADPYGRPAL